jgi:hypothetical protein
MPRYRIVVVLALCALLGFVTRSYAGCKGSAEITGSREQQLRVMLSTISDEGAFHVLSETTDSDGRWKFVLYVNNTAGDRTNAKSVHFAGLTGDNTEKVAFTYDVSRYLQKLESQLTKPSENRIQEAQQHPQIVDGCLNTLQFPEDAQGLHLNLFLEDPQLGISAATDALFAIRAHGTIQPVLELDGTSLVRTRGTRKLAHQDSTIWLRQTDGNAMEVIWEQFNKNAAGMMTVKYSQNVVYRWEETGFLKVGTLQPNQLAEHLKGALALTRCDAIIPLRFKVEEPGPNQAAP